jgi:hypothetical protein
MKFVDGCFEGFSVNAKRNVPSREQVQHLLATVTEVCVLLHQFWRHHISSAELDEIFSAKLHPCRSNNLGSAG